MIGDLLQLRITETYGLTPSASRSGPLEQGLQEMKRRLGVDEQELAVRIVAQPELLRELAGYVTVDESYFLRHPEQYDAVLDVLEQQLARSKDPVQVWSLGCAHGEEPYSVAILARERLGADAARVRIRGTDINPRVLDTARRATYRDWSFRGVPAAFIAKHFERLPDGAYRLLERYVAAVDLELAALSERLVEVPPRSIDVVLFRNVGIYFESRALTRTFERLAQIVKLEGLLVTAPADPSPPGELFARAASQATGIFALRSPASCRERRSEAAELAVGGAPGRAPAERGRPETDTAGSSPTAVSSGSPTAPARAPAGSGPTRATRRLDDIHAMARPPGGDSGRPQPERRLREATAAIEAHPQAVEVYVQRGRLLLGALQPREAARDFRSALYLDPGDVVTRFWYATALQCAGQTRQARSQALRLTEALEPLAADAVLSDGRTQARELLDAVLLMRATLP